MFSRPDPEAPVKVIDFGFAARYDPTQGPLHKQLGTFDTMAPEVFGGNYTTQADMWSAGVVAFELIAGKKPFAAASQLGVIGKIANGEINLNDKKWKDKSPSSKTFVKALIKRDPQQRLNAAAALRHKWIRDIPKSNLSESTTMRSMGDHLLKYGEAPTIKKIGLLMIAHKTFPDEIVKLQNHFARFDTQHTGTVTLEEFGKALLEINHDVSREEIQKMFKSIDTYESGEIAYTEFIAAMLEKYVHINEDRIDDAFDRIDVTNSGFISTEDLRLILGRDFTEEKAKDIISQIDADHDGKSKWLKARTLVFVDQLVSDL